MGDSSDDEVSNEWVPYSERDEWKDVKPLEQDDGENAVVVIAYSDKCKWNLWHFGRVSRRPRHEPNDCKEFHILFISVHSVPVKEVFNYFRAILSSGEKTQRALELTHDALELNASNYTVWQYR